jgi:hypothetical protein
MELFHSLIQGIMTGNWEYFQACIQTAWNLSNPLLCWHRVPSTLFYRLILGLAFWGLVILGCLLYRQIQELKQS